MNFVGHGNPAPAEGEQVVCGECRALMADYVRDQPALLGYFAKRGLTEKDQWHTVLGYARDAVLQVPGCRVIPGFGGAKKTQGFARCVDPRCKCTASFNGAVGQHCCFTCHNGKPCVTNCHQQPFEWPPEAAGRAGMGGPGGAPKSLAHSLMSRLRNGDHAQRAEIAKAMRPRFGETPAEMEDRLRRATAPPADARARRRVMAQSSLWTRLDKEREDALALPEGIERDMAVRVASEKRLKTEMFMWKRLDPDQVTTPSVVADIKGKPARARAMRERTVYQFGVLLCRRLLEDAQSSLSTRMDTYVKGAMKRFRYSAARLDTSFSRSSLPLRTMNGRRRRGCRRRTSLAGRRCSCRRKRSTGSSTRFGKRPCMEKSWQRAMGTRLGVRRSRPRWRPGERLRRAEA